MNPLYTLSAALPGGSALVQAGAVLVEVGVLFALATLVFDAIHWTLHCWTSSRLAVLRWLGGLHQAHHDFFDDSLRFHDAHRARNLLLHVVPEYLTQLLVTSTALFFLRPSVVIGAVALESVFFAATMCLGGKDPNHRELKKVSAPPHGVLVTSSYHAGHHLFPGAFFGSYTTLFDVLMGTAIQLRGRRVVITGASGAFGAPLKALLEREGVRSITSLKYGVDYSYQNYSGADAALRDADILVLAHGAKRDHAMEANCDSFIALIERFRTLARDRQFPPEVWAVGSEIEAHPAFGDEELQIYSQSKRAYARYAHQLYFDRSVIYRHIVPSAFTSRMGPGLVSGAFAARVALFLIRRGLRYVPVTYTGVALLNYFKFLAAGLRGPRTGIATTAERPARAVPVPQIALWLAAALGAASSARAEEPWQVVSTGSVVAKTRPVKGGAVQEIWAETNLAASVQDLQATLLDGESFPKFMPYTKEVRQLGPAGPDGTWLVYTRVAPPFIAHRDYVAKVRLDRSVAPDGTGVFESHWQALDGHVPRTEGVVRIVVNEGHWLVTPLSDGRSHVVYQFRLDPGGWIPPWLADLGNRSALNDVFKSVETEARRRGAARARAAR